MLCSFLLSVALVSSRYPLHSQIGWRRFQSLPVFSTEDENERERFIKYTPEHMHCIANFYGPLVPPNSGILAFYGPSSTTTGFRIGLTGTVLEAQRTPGVVKKLKLVGTPTKIFRNTAFITGMFNSALEVSKFEGCKIKTVSGIRGQIKKAVRGGEPGKFRATFEDKILMSDIVICRLWVPVEVKDFYNPMLSLLSATAAGDAAAPGAAGAATGSSSSSSTLMRTVAELRRQQQIPIPVNVDSLYKPITRVTREFQKFKVPTKLQEQLPFKSKPKLAVAKKGKNATYMSRRAVVLEPEDRNKRAAVQMLATISADKLSKRKVAQTQRSAKQLKVKEKVAERFASVAKEEKKRKYRDEGKEKILKEKGMRVQKKRKMQ
jgi:ribosome biogenesis protein BMS1